MAVIAMTREMGTLGKDVASGVAEALGLRMVHHELVEHDVAERLGVRESAVHQYLEGSASLMERWKIDKAKLSRYTALEILELAQEGNVVIRGWGATALLRDVPHVLRVRVCAPMAFREAVLEKRLGLDGRDAARRIIENSDAAHARIVRSFFGIDWQNPIHYHVVLNTDGIPIATGIDLLRGLASSAVFEETPATRAAMTDRLLEWRIRDSLAARHTGDLLANIEVSVKDGAAVLVGTASDSQMARLAAQLARDVPGIRELETRVVVLRAYGGM